MHLHSRRGADTWGGLAARLAGVPCVLSRRVDNPESRLAVAIKYRLYDHVITISEGIRQVLLGEGLAKRLPLKLIRWIAAGVFVLTGVVTMAGAASLG